MTWLRNNFEEPATPPTTRRTDPAGTPSGGDPRGAPADPSVEEDRGPTT